MTIRVALNHRTTYEYDRQVRLGPQYVRLRPAPHCRTPIASYSLKVRPAKHFVNWQQDPYGNYLARFVFPEPTHSLAIEVDLVTEMTVINPFDFFIDPSAEEVPFVYESGLARDLLPFLGVDADTPRVVEFTESVRPKHQRTVPFLVDLNQQIQRCIQYDIRLEPGVQSAEETLTLARGSCRDSAWLLVQVLRRLGCAARFVSGYLIQLVPDVKSLDGPSGPDADFTDLHAWAEIYLPGAGWIGLDPTSGLFAGEGHLPLACTPEPGSAAPISGNLEPCEVGFQFQMQVTRVHEDPRVTRPYTDAAWTAIGQLGDTIDSRLASGDVRLTMGGEPTFVSMDDMDGPEWNTAAVGPHKRKLAELLIKRLRARFAPGGLLHYGQGKWYPGEPLPRWALACIWRKDGIPIWHDDSWIADTDRAGNYQAEQARHFMSHLAGVLGVNSDWIRPAFEDIAHYLWKEQRLPINVAPDDPKLKDSEERARMVRLFEQGLNEPVGFVMPIRRQWQQARGRWQSGSWPVRSEHLFLLPGDSPLGLRLPIDSLPAVASTEALPWFPRDPFEERPPLSALPPYRPQGMLTSAAVPPRAQQIHEQVLERRSDANVVGSAVDEAVPPHVVRTALCVEAREGRLHVFMPPVEFLEDYLDLISAIETTATELSLPVVIEGYLPPSDDRIRLLKVTPDPGVMEVNTYPVGTWGELVEQTVGLYEEARAARLATEKFDLDGHHTGTGGGNHVILGGPRPQDSPLLRRPDVLKSLVGYWNNHPSLSYLFSGRCIGPTSQAPRVDEGRRDALYELQMAFQRVPQRGNACPPWLIDRLFRNLLVDGTGNTHRAEFCIDKLYSPDSATGRLGLLEFRGFEMPPHPRMSLTQQLLLRGLVAWFWDDPYEQRLVDWGTSLHDRFMLPHYVWRDFLEVLTDLTRVGLAFDPGWFLPHFEFRFPLIGTTCVDGVELELRAAIEPWYVLGEEPAGGGTVRYIDSSVERMQVRVNGSTSDRYVVCCQGRRVPLQPSGVPGTVVAGVRYRAWQPPHCLHPTIAVHTPLVFDILDTWTGRSLGGCTYHAAHPAGRNYTTFPVNAYEAEARRGARFQTLGHTPGQLATPPGESNPAFPLTLDLRWESLSKE